MANTVNPFESDQMELFDRFRQELEKWASAGDEPADGSREIRYYLNLQRRRLKESGLTMHAEFTPLENTVTSTAKFMEKYGNLSLYKSSAPFEQNQHFQHIRKKVSYVRDGRRIYDLSQNAFLNQTIIEPSDSERDIGETTYNCPNCGAVTKVSILEREGCPYCGTRFKMKELYPKVTNLYFQESMALSQEQGSARTKHSAAAGAVIFTLAAILINLVRGTLTPGGIIAALIFCNLVGALIGVIAGNIFTALQGARITVQSLPMARTAKTRGRITNEMRRYDPSFSYEYFEGKALSLARIAAFSKKGENCPQYRPDHEDGDDRASFANVLDMQYRGGFMVRGIRESGGMLHLDLDLMIRDTVDDGRRVRDRNDVWAIRMHHRTQFPVDPSFSIHKVQCRGCGASFDALRTVNCPYCGREYDAGMDDWVVDGIRIVPE